jgi:hypothetical protein
MWASDAGRIDIAQAGLGGQGREAGPVLDAVKALLFHVAVEGVEA